MSWSPWVWVGIFAFVLGGGAIVLAMIMRRLWRQAKELSAELERVLAQADELSQVLAAAGAAAEPAGRRAVPGS